MSCGEGVELYKNKGFCIAMQCRCLSKGKKRCKIIDCVHTAKAFHHWLNINGFCISKCIKASKGNK